MLRFHPLDGDGEDAWRGKPSAASRYLRSIGGDELNVCVDLAQIGRDTEWISVLPSGPLGEVVSKNAKENGVKVERVVEVEGADMGLFFTLPELKRVHYQRKQSAFCTHKGDLFDWKSMLHGNCWLIMTGITPMLGEGVRESWAQAIRAAQAKKIPVSFDLNHRPQLGTLEQLWGYVKPLVSAFIVLILSLEQLRGLIKLSGLEPGTINGERAAKKQKIDASADVHMMRQLHAHLNGPALAVCFKNRDSSGLQRRWSVIVDATGVHSTEDVATLHEPQEECGGGSAWHAGIIDGIFTRGFEPPMAPGKALSLGGKELVLKAMRRADLLAAMCQEVPGDHSTVKRHSLAQMEAKFAGISARVPRGDPNEIANNERIQAALKKLEAAKVIAILRARQEQLTVKRAVELVSMGFQAIEVTCDSAGFKEGRLLPAIVEAIGGKALVGVGTVMTLEELELAKRGGAQYALSPVNPCGSGWPQGFVGECHSRGILAMPAAFSPQEIYEAVDLQGALCVKVMPAQLWTPAALQDLRRIGPYTKMKLCPTGGINAKTAGAWLKAGCVAVGMGGSLSGKDISSDDAGLAAAEKEWAESGRANAQEIANRFVLGLE